MLLRVGTNIWPADEWDAAGEASTIVAVLMETDHCGGRDLYLRFCRVCDRVQGTFHAAEYEALCARYPLPMPPET